MACHHRLWTHGRTTLDVVCHHRPWAAYTVRRHWVWHIIIAFGQNTWSKNVKCGMLSSPLGNMHQRRRGRVMPISPFEEYTFERCGVLDAIINLGQQTRSDNVGQCMPSRSWTSYTIEQRQACHDIIALGLHKWPDDVRHGMPAWAVGRINGRATSDMTCHHRNWVAHTIELCRSWHARIVLGQHTWLDDVERHMESSPLGSKHRQTM